MSEFSIAAGEFKERVAKVQALLVERELDGLLAFSTESEPTYVRYLANYWPLSETGAVLVPAKGEAVLLIGPESLTYAQHRSRLDTIIQLSDLRESSQPEYPEAEKSTWQDVFRQFSIRRLGLAGWHMFPHAIYENVRAALGPGEIVQADDLIRLVAMRKTPAEIACLREATRICTVGLQAVLDRLCPGMTEIQVIGVATGAMMNEGMEPLGYGMICCSGPNSAHAISRPTRRVIQNNEIVQVGVGGTYGGYTASVTRPFIMGSVPNETVAFLEVGRQAEMMTIDLMRAGTRASDVARKVHGWIREQGYGDAILYGPAHGVGQMECEYPFVETSSDIVLEENMTFQADMFLSRPGIGFRWQDPFVVRDGPPDQFPTFRREIISI